MDKKLKNISVFKVAANLGDVTVSALEVYKTLLSVKYFAADSLANALCVFRSGAEKLKGTTKKQEPSALTVENKNEKVKENTSMKKSTFWALVAFAATACAAVAGIAYYLKKREKELEEYDDMLFNDNCLADYLPKDEEDCGFDDCCCEKAENSCENDIVEF